MSNRPTDFRRPKKLSNDRVIPYAIIEHLYWDDQHVAKIGLAAWAVFSYLLRLANSADAVMPDLPQIAKVCGLSREGVRLAIKKLREKGYIEHVRSGCGRGNCSEYKIACLVSVPATRTIPAETGNSVAPLFGKETGNTVAPLEGEKGNCKGPLADEQKANSVAPFANSVAPLGTPPPSPSPIPLSSTPTPQTTTTGGNLSSSLSAARPEAETDAQRAAGLLEAAGLFHDDAIELAGAAAEAGGKQRPTRSASQIVQDVIDSCAARDDIADRHAFIAEGCRKGWQPSAAVLKQRGAAAAAAAEMATAQQRRQAAFEEARAKRLAAEAELEAIQRVRCEHQMRLQGLGEGELEDLRARALAGCNAFVAQAIGRASHTQSHYLASLMVRELHKQQQQAAALEPA